MSVKFPQADLPSGGAARGGADLWDVPQAGVVLADDYFSSPVSLSKLYFRSTQINGIGATYYDLIPVAGSSADTAVVNTTVAGTEIQFTKTAGGALVNFITGRAPIGGFTLTSTDISAWAKESSLLNNVGLRYRVFKRDSGGTETELGGGAYDNGAEITDVDAEYTWTGNVTDTAFAENDRLLIKVYVINVGVMAVGTATFTFNAADAATGDSFLNISPAVTFKAESGGSFNSTITESVTLGESSSAIIVVAKSISEPATLTESSSSTIIVPKSISEAIALTESPSSTISSANSITETIVLAETSNGSVGSFDSTITELVALTESQASTILVSVSRTEPITLAETPTSTVIAPALISETITLSESEFSTIQVGKSISEPMALADAPTSTILASVNISEAIALAESSLATKIVSSTIIESIALAETSNAIVLILGIASESISLAESSSSTGIFNSASLEPIVLSDIPVSTIIAVAITTENISLADIVDAGQLAQAIVSEAITLNSAQSSSVGGAIFNSSILELITLNELSDTIVSLISSSQTEELPIDYSQLFVQVARRVENESSDIEEALRKRFLNGWPY